MQRKLSGWKTKNLSFAGRENLVQAVTSTVPNYTIQILKLPNYVCDKINRLNMNFLWGDTMEKKKAHLVKW